MRSARFTIDLDWTGAASSTPPGPHANFLRGTIMGFWSGRVTFTRYRVGGETPVPFGGRHLEQAQAHLIGRHGSPDPVDGVATGWSGGEHVLDLILEAGKNIVDDALHLAIRVDADKIPGALLRAYTQIETDALAQLNASGIATKAQKQEAKEAAKRRAEAEAADGRFRRINHFPVLWDGRTNTLYAGSTSATVLDRIQSLFRETFDRTLEPITAGTLAGALTSGDHDEPAGRAKALDRGRFTLVGAGEGGDPHHLAWSEDDPTSLDYLGNEFLVWIWHSLQNVSDSIKLSDGSNVTVMLAKTLTLDCPRGEMGRDHLTDDEPIRLPEAFRALQAGKLPRKAGMVLVRHGAEYELTLQAETLAVSGAGLPKPEVSRASTHETRSTRLDNLRHMTETLDLLFQAYLDRRNSSSWSDEVGRIRRWLHAA
jgi:hypothetical protein